jgi:hypothetical protein
MGRNPAARSRRTETASPERAVALADEHAQRAAKEQHPATLIEGILVVDNDQVEPI